MIFLINGGEDNMARAKKMRRDSKGRFVGKARASRSSRKSTRRATTRRRSSRSSTTRKRNPDIFGQVVDGAKGAGLILAGEAVTRSAPRLVGLPTSGPAGLATQAAAAIAAGMVADRLMGADAGALVLASGLAVPLRSLVVGANIPVVSDALRGGGSAAAYVQPGARRSGGRLSAYVQPMSLSGYGDAGCAPCGGTASAAGLF